MYAMPIYTIFIILVNYRTTKGSPKIGVRAFHHFQGNYSACD
jgi:hypothetical protein